MNPAFLVRLRPLGPWRFGPGEGGVDRVDTLYRSDRLYSALTIAMRQLGALQQWLDETALAAEPAISLSSLFPFQGDVLFAVPPRTLWPPPSSLVSAPSQVFLSKIRWADAHFVPLSVIDALISGQNILADQWLIDGESGCLLRRDRPSSSPFRSAVRRTAAVDRQGHATAEVSASACVEFEPGAGLWTVVRFRDREAQSRWESRVEAAFRLLADSGFGGRRSSGWGQTQTPEFQRGQWPQLILPKAGRSRGNGASGDGERREDARFWLLSLYSPAMADQVDWTRGEYQVTIRSGFVDGRGAVDGAKRSLRMIAEGSVLEAASPLTGVAVNVAPDGLEHPVYRSGLALTFELPPAGTGSTEADKLDLRSVEEPEAEETATAPCEVAAEETKGPEEVAEPLTEAEPLSQAEQEAAVSPETGVERELAVEPEVEAKPEIEVEREDNAEPEFTVEPDLENDSRETANPEAAGSDITETDGKREETDFEI